MWRVHACRHCIFSCPIQRGGVYLHGKSTGRIESEAQLKSDVRRAWDTIAPRYAGKHKVIVGHSRGTDLAAAVAAEIQPDLTVLVSPFFSMAAIAREQYPLVSGFLPHVPGTTHDDVHESPRYTATLADRLGKL